MRDGRLYCPRSLRVSAPRAVAPERRSSRYSRDNKIMENDRSGGNVLGIVMAGGRGESINSNVGEGTIISGSLMRGSVIGRNVRINSYSLIEDSIIMDRVEIGRGCRIRRAIIDKHNVIAAGTEIGANLARDRERFFVSNEDIILVQRGDLNNSESPLVPNTSPSYLAEL